MNKLIFLIFILTSNLALSQALPNKASVEISSALRIAVLDKLIIHVQSTESYNLSYNDTIIIEDRRFKIYAIENKNDSIIDVTLSIEN